LARERAARLGLTFDASKLKGPHAEVVRVAARYLGVPYIWGGTTPTGFDCSGLAQYCYAQIGLALPRTSREQFRAGAYIPPDRKDLLEPGDLVFFGYEGDANRIHHVGIYAGGGSFIHAPQSGDVVRVTSLSERSDYVGACRP
jgi:cell wall-associated NlpC family hydrolase